MNSNDDESLASDDVATEDAAVESTTTETAVAEDVEDRLDLDVDIQESGPCRKHVRIKIPRQDIDRLYAAAVNELSTKVDVPGFRTGHAPQKLIGKRFRQELSGEVKQKVLLKSLEQLTEDYKLDPINEPNLDVENIEIPEAGDFEYEFDVEVRPDFELPDYRSLEIERPVRQVSDSDVDNYMQQFLAQYGIQETVEGAAEKDDYVTVSVTFTHAGNPLRELSDMTVQLKPTLRFQDAELAGFEQLMVGATAGDTKEAEITVSLEADNLEMRGETVHARFTVKNVKRLELPVLNKEFLQKVGVETEEELRVEVNGILERQVTYEQRQATRQQVLEKITESADWELPEELVRNQVDNAVHRETLEMQQAGFTTREIQARENEIRQRSISSTRQAMKEHFVLDRIAELEKIEVTPSDIETEIQMMAMQRGESPRRLRARLAKSGVIENLEAQIRERKAVDKILENAEFKDVEMKRTAEDQVEAVNQSVCTTISSIAASTEDAEDEDDSKDSNAGN